MTETDGITFVPWSPPRSISAVLDGEGRPRPLESGVSGFDLSWSALDAWSAHVASGNPCEIVLTGYYKRSDGHYWYAESINPEYLREVLGWREQDGRLLPLCVECDGYPRHKRGCSLAP